MTSTFTEFIRETFLFIGGVTLLIKEIIRETFRKGKISSLTMEQIYQIGERSLPLVLITAACTGAVMTMQFGQGLAKFGGTLYVPRLVTVSILREMGPVFTALMIAARAGAGIASEVGSMVVTQQVDAIRAMGSSPVQKIVVPRVLASLVAVPLLVGIANFVCFLGGLFIGSVDLKLDPEFYLLRSLNGLALSDYLSGWGKSFFFALFISVPACYFGLNVKDGTRGVGVATTKAVVVSSILVLVGDFFLTKLFWIIESWF
jgi:phospholipid/cholesterol/gamma-HCH transport system permease protein